MQLVPERAEGQWPQTATEADRLLDEAIIKSLCYADVFNFALTLEEIVRFAPYASITAGDAAARLTSSEPLKAVVREKGGLYYLKGREDNCQVRLDRETESKQQLKTALKRLIPLQGVPFLRAAAVTGALAAFNSPDGDDVDLLIISSRRRTWTAFFFLRLWRHFGRNPEICFNVFLTESDLVFRNQNLFYAREILGAIPIYNTGSFERFLEANPWIHEVFPSHSPDPQKKGYRLPADEGWRRRQQSVELFLSGYLGDLFEMVVRRVQFGLLTRESPGASLSMRKNRIKLHRSDHRMPILDKYEQRVSDRLAIYREAAAKEAIRPV